MAASGFTPISLYYSATASSVPLAANLVAGELSLNTNDGKLYYKNSSSVVTLLAAASGASGDVVGPASATDNALARFDLTTGKLIQNSVGILSDAGVLTGLTGLTSSGSITLSSLTSGRVPYATTAGLLTDSANLLYSGTDLTVYGVRVGRGGGALSTNTAVGSGVMAATATGINNSAFGYIALPANTTGANNTAIGHATLFTNTTGGSNSAFGVGALQNNTTGGDNTAVGFTAGFSNTTASNLTAVGKRALYSNTTGNFNTAIGLDAAPANTTGASLVAAGYHALFLNTTGSNNTAIGDSPLANNTTGSNNTALGVAALLSNTTASQNTAVGFQAAYSNVTNTPIVAVGYQALYSSTADHNVALGYQAGYSTTTGSQSIAIGTQANYSATTNGGSVIIGYNAGRQGNNNQSTAVGWSALYNNTAAQITAVGYASLQANTSGTQNTAVGYNSLNANTTGASNTAMGYYALYASTTSSDNTAVGYATLQANTTGAGNSGFGRSSLQSNTTGASNTALGYAALQANTTASDNTAVGWQAAYSNTTGAQNTAVGRQALAGNTTASANTAMGYQAAINNTTGANQTAIGQNALYTNTTGTNNTAIGVAALQSNTTGSGNTALGISAGFSITTGSKNVVIGSYTGSAAPISQTGSNYIVLSDGDGNVRQTIDSSGNVGIGTSSPSSYGLLSVVSSTAGSAKISIQDTSGGASPAPLLQFGVNSSNGFNTSDAVRVWATSPSSSTAALNFAAYSGGAPSTAQMTLTGGNVGIGTSSPAYKLDVSGAASATPVTNGIVRILTTGSNPPTGNGGGLLFAQVNSASANTNYASITGSRVDSTANNKVDLVFATGAPSDSIAVAERMRINSGGAVFINATSAGSFSAGARLSVLGIDGEFSVAIKAPNTSTYNVISFENNNGQVGRIQTSGSATSFLTSSDYRLKEDIAPMTGALAKVAALKPVTYKWKVDGTDGQGFIAHELQEVVPDCVGGNKDAVDANGNPQYQGVDTSFLVATLTAAIQEQQALITSLTARIAALEST